MPLWLTEKSSSVEVCTASPYAASRREAMAAAIAARQKWRTKSKWHAAALADANASADAAAYWLAAAATAPCNCSKAKAVAAADAATAKAVAAAEALVLAATAEVTAKAHFQVYLQEVERILCAEAAFSAGKEHQATVRMMGAPTDFDPEVDIRMLFVKVWGITNLKEHDKIEHTYNRYLCFLYCKASDAIAVLKAKIQYKLQRGPCHCDLIFRGKKLADRMTLQSCYNDCIIHCVFTSEEYPEAAEASQEVHCWRQNWGIQLALAASAAAT